MQQLNRPGWIDFPAPDVGWQLAMDEALLWGAENGLLGESIRIWEAPYLAVVLGAGGSVAIDVNQEVCTTDNVPIFRRASGGGTVLIGPGCLQFSLILAYERHPALREVKSSYDWILTQVAALLGDTQTIELQGISDLAVSDRAVARKVKISGNAQQRKRHHVLHHGTILYRFPLEAISRYLNAPERQPTYRGNRPHESFLINHPIEPTDFAEKLRLWWDCRAEAIPPEVESEAEKLLNEKYSQQEWTFRRA
ncbi:MAG: lipoate--protein ligase family protein [Zavarzinella sp.]